MKILVVDDEKPARDRLVRLIEETKQGHSILTAENGIKALEALNKNLFDAVFLDIEMPGLNGMETAATINSFEPSKRPKIVFATAYDEFAIKAFEENATDYLLKPIESTRLATTLDRCQQPQGEINPLLASTRLPHISRIGLKIGNHIAVVAIEDISCISACGNYTEVTENKNKHVADDSLASLTQRLPEFCRIHRSHLINPAFVSQLSKVADKKTIVKLNDFYESELPVSREYTPTLKQIFSGHPTI